MKSFVLSIVAGLSFGLLFGVNSARAAAGSLDPTFGKGGIAQTSGFSGAFFPAAALQSDGKIVIEAGNEVLRYLSTRALDTSFGNGRSVQVSTGGSVALQSDGKILVAGEAPNSSDFIVTRLNSNGTVDTGFGSQARRQLSSAPPTWARRF